MQSRQFDIVCVDFPGTAPGTPPAAGAPASPAGLRASVYSATSAELFWTRAATPGLRYEVRRDGNVVTTTTGISHYASGLAAGRDYAYQVITIDGAGKRSAPASIGVSTRGGSSTGTPTPPVTPPSSGGGTLAAIQPKDVSIKIYSSTAAELFWTPAGAFRPVIEKNEIRRDGVLIATLEGEFLRSYFDNRREAGKRYTYEITAISSAGRASAQISDTGVNPPQPVTPPTTPTPVTDLPATVNTKLATTFEIINGVPVEKVMATLGRLADRDARIALGLVRNGSRTGINGGVADVFNCPKGGNCLTPRVKFPSDALATRSKQSTVRSGQSSSVALHRLMGHLLPVVVSDRVRFTHWLSSWMMHATCQPSGARTCSSSRMQPTCVFPAGPAIECPWIGRNVVTVPRPCSATDVIRGIACRTAVSASP